MAVRHGYGKVAGADALVFAYDTGDTRNSYKGEPTENLLSYTTEFDSWTKARNSGTTPTVTSNTSPNPLGLRNAPMADTLVIPDDGTYPRIQQYFTPSSTNQHTMSVWIRSLSGDCDCFLGIFRNSPWSLPGSTVVSVTSEWQRFSFTMTPPDTTTHVAYIGSHDTAAQKGNTLELWGAMIEENSHKTPFTAGTRSATQGLLDLTGRVSLDMTNVSFNSSAQPTWDGTNDYISMTGFTQPIDPNNFSVEAVVKLYAHNPGTNIGSVIVNNYSGLNGWIFYLDGPDSRLGLRHHYNGTSGAYSIESTTGINLNQWYHIMGTDDGTTVRLYVNGVQVQSGASATATNYSGQPLIGQFGGNNAVTNGDIPIAKIYNRALTAAEVKNNYNNYKGRFNI